MEIEVSIGASPHHILSPPMCPTTRRFIRTLLVLLFTFAAASLQASEAEALIKQLRKVAAPGSGIGAAEQKVAQKLQKLGRPAISLLIPLLRDQDEEVRSLASYTLCDMPGLTEGDLDALIESRLRGDGWIPPAIASIGTPKAVQFLLDELVREHRTQTQLTWALIGLGDKAVPGLVSIVQNEKSWNDELESAVRHILHEMGAKAASAVEPLMKSAQDESLPEPQRLRAIAAVGAIGLPAESAVPILTTLRAHPSDKIKGLAATAILDIGAREAAAIWLDRLAEAQDSFSRILILRDIAAMRDRGVEAGPALLKYLRDPDWTVRVCAVRTLGYIGYADSAETLIALLDNPEDWRLVFSAAEALGRLPSAAAIPRARNRRPRPLVSSRPHRGHPGDRRCAGTHRPTAQVSRGFPGRVFRL
jgi:HEAT repeat protein